MAKREINYNPQLAEHLIMNTSPLAEMETHRIWQMESSMDQNKETAALPEIWASPEAFKNCEPVFSNTIIVLATVNGLDTLRPELKDLGRAGKGCHDNFCK